MNNLEKRIPVGRLRNFIEYAFISVGAKKKHANTCSLLMIESDLQGMHGHGIFRLPAYIKRAKEGGYNFNPKIKHVKETDLSTIVDGDNGLGHVVVNHATELAIKKAKKNGMAWVGTRNSNHAGAGGVYTSMALQNDMIGLYMAVGNANHMPPWGGVERLLSTNPISFAIPAYKEYPILLDMATTVASYGKVKVHAQTGEKLPEGWMIDSKGFPLTDPNCIEKGFLLPIGGYKGYGLNLVVGMLAGVLNSASFGKDVIDFNKDFHTPTNSGQSFFALRIDLFGDTTEFKKKMDIHIREIKESTPMNADSEIRLPGERGFRERPKIINKGIPVSKMLLSQLNKLAIDLKLPDNLEDILTST